MTTEPIPTKYLFVHSNHYRFLLEAHPATGWKVLIDDEVPEHLAIILDKLPPVRLMYWPELDVKRRFHCQLPAPVRVHDFPERYDKDGIRYSLRRIDINLDKNTETAIYLKDAQHDQPAPA